MNNFIGKFIVICLLCTTPLAAFAHELWLEPEQFILQANTDLKADIKVGQQLNGNKYPYIKSETKSLKLFLKKKEIKLTHRDGDYPANQSPIKNEGLHILSYESVPEKVNYANFEIFKTFMPFLLFSLYGLSRAINSNVKPVLKSSSVWFPTWIKDLA